MTSIVVVGAQWGDEGKGKITDFLSEKADYVARYNGGNNAGHTIQFGGATYKLHLVPSGIFYKDKISVIGNGCVLDPKSLTEELDKLEAQGIQADNLRISNRATIVLPYHLRQDELEENRKGDNKIGTTKKGIGPAYMDKIARIGIRMADLIDKDTFSEKLNYAINEKNHLFSKLYNSSGFTFDEIFEEYYNYGQKLAKHVCDTSVIVNEASDQSKNILFEGAQGVMLDIDHGTYPFVTSSNSIAGGVATGIGFAPSKVEKVIGVCKAYTTRVGDGPFPTELFDGIGHQIREVGREYGTTTGRPRRVGWFDTVVMRHTKRVSGISDLALNCLDVLSGLKTVKICIAYELDGKIIKEYPANLKQLERCKPIYEELPGWEEDITGIRSFDALPAAAQNYLKRASALSEIKLSIFSIGPDRIQTVILEDPYGE